MFMPPPANYQKMFRSAPESQLLLVLPPAPRASTALGPCSSCRLMGMGWGAGVQCSPRPGLFPTSILLLLGPSTPLCPVYWASAIFPSFSVVLPLALYNSVNSTTIPGS